MGFVEFVKGKRNYAPYKLKNRISIRKHGVIGFSKGFVEKYQLRNYNYIQFLFDEESMKLGFRFLEKEIEGSYTLRKTETNTYANCLALLKLYKIPNEERRYFSFTFDPEGKVFVIDLNKEEVEEVKGED